MAQSPKPSQPLSVRPPLAQRLLPLAFVAVGLAMVAMGVTVLWLPAAQGSTQGTIAQKVAMPTSSEQPYYLVIRFRLSGQASPMWVNVPVSQGHFNSVREGDTLELLYDPDDPAGAHLAEPRWDAWVILAAGVAMVAAGCVMFARRRARR